MSNLNYEELNNRRLWIDGESTLDKDGLYDKILSGEDIEGKYTHVSDSEIKKFSKLTGIKLKTKDSPDYNKIHDQFLLPKAYFEINLEDFFIERMKSRHGDISKPEMEKRVARIYDELSLYKEMFLEDILRLAIYIVDTFTIENIIWGPGRGSSCCSYLLFLTELHDVDSVYFDLDIDEFLRKQ